MEVAKLGTDLKLAFPIRWHDTVRPDPKDAGKTITVSEPLIWAYSIPIGREVFEANYRVISAAKAAIFSKGIAYAADSGPRIATLALMDAADQDAAERDLPSAGPALRAEIARLTSILVPGDHGFEMVPAELAVKRSIIDAEEWSEAESAIVFFTLGYAMASRAKRTEIAQACALVLGALTTSLAPMEFAGSLQTSTPDATSAPADALLVPS